MIEYRCLDDESQKVTAFSSVDAQLRIDPMKNSCNVTSGNISTYDLHLSSSVVMISICIFT